MMAASICAAARSVLRPASFLGEGVRRLSNTHQQPVPNHASQIKLKKEELYELVVEADADYATTWFDRLLLKDLSTQVEPRPYDPQWRKIIATQVVTTYTYVAGVLVSTGLIVRSLTDGPKIVEYNGHRVTAESLTMLKGYQPDATPEGVHKQDGYQPVPTARVGCKQ